MIENRDQVMERLARVREGASTEWLIGKEEAWLILECFKRDHERMIELEEALMNMDDQIQMAKDKVGILRDHVGAVDRHLDTLRARILSTKGTHAISR